MVSKTFGLAALASLCFAEVAAPADAGVFEASADSVSVVFGGTISLPKYSGPGTITRVTLAFNGVAGGNQEEEYDYTAIEGLMSDGRPETVGFSVFGPNAPGGMPGSPGAVLEGFTSFESAAVDIPPGPCEPYFTGECVRFVDSDFFEPVSGTAMLTDFSDFAGSGSSDFILNEDLGHDQIPFGVSGTLTETITFTAPEPSTWIMMLVGFAGLGAVAGRSRRVMV